MSRMILNGLNALVNLVLVICLCLAAAYAGFALWDNNRVYTAAEEVQADMVKLKPVLEEEDGGASFDELLAVNPDVCGWVTMEGTSIDFPILQGQTNLTYINTDVYGNFALAGSIFLDSRNDRAFTEPYNLLYGHHMENSGMFGDLDLYKDEEFFRENQGGTLILPEGSFKLQVFACMLVNASEDVIFDPTMWNQGTKGLLSFTRETAMYLDETVLEQLETDPQGQILALSTCASEFTDARTIVLTRMVPTAGQTAEG